MDGDYGRALKSRPVFHFDGIEIINDVSGNLHKFILMIDKTSQSKLDA